jgi:hypothetical protein
MARLRRRRDAVSRSAATACYAALAPTPYLCVRTTDTVAARTHQTRTVAARPGPRTCRREPVASCAPDPAPDLSQHNPESSRRKSRSVRTADRSADPPETRNAFRPPRSASHRAGPPVMLCRMEPGFDQGAHARAPTSTPRSLEPLDAGVRLPIPGCQLVAPHNNNWAARSRGKTAARRRLAHFGLA